MPAHCSAPCADRGGTSELKVKATRLSNLIASLDRVDAVKIDVEGAEWHILKDLQQSGTLAKPMRYLIEYHHQMGSVRWSGRSGQAKIATSPNHEHKKELPQTHCRLQDQGGT